MKTKLDRPLKDIYYEYILGLVGLDTRCVMAAGADRYYTKLMQKLHGRVFKPFVELDINRALDGFCLRYDFRFDLERGLVEVNGVDKKGKYMYTLSDEEYAELNGPCSVLEMIIALCNRRWDYGYNAYKNPGDMFFEIIHNLGLLRYDDYHWNEKKVDKRIDILIYRKYDSQGNGGMFPISSKYGILNEKIPDQRDLEIWLQFDKYLSAKYGHRSIKYRKNVNDIEN